MIAVAEGLVEGLSLRLGACQHLKRRDRHEIVSNARRMAARDALIKADLRRVETERPRAVGTFPTVTPHERQTWQTEAGRAARCILHVNRTGHDPDLLLESESSGSRLSR